jgi:aldehyde dehydrogenase (NAD+)
VDLVSFTGSCRTGALVQTAAGARLAKVCLELGGKNALVVCDDADLDNAARWVLASAFSNAGQRCAAASRIIVFDGVYEALRERLVRGTEALRIGPDEDAFLGPVINERQLNHLLDAVSRAAQAGARVLAGGHRLSGPAHAGGYYMAPTLLENVSREAEIARQELFGPVTILFRVKDFDAAVALANDSPYGLTTAIHTNSLHRAMTYSAKAQAGVVVVNGGTHGSEPHMGFGGVKSSGTGWREAGLEALDVYSDWKYVNLIHDPGKR